MPSQKATVLIIDLPGFAELSGKLEGGELQALLHAMEELANATLQLHEGIISNFAGDSFLAVFTAQKAGTFTSHQALEAFLEFRERMESLLETKKLAKEVSLKAGIATADAIITGLDEQDKGKVTVMGQAVTFATRLKDFAEKEQALTDGQVFEQAKGRFDFLQLEPLPLRGSKEALQVYELKGKKRAKWKLDAVSERKITSEMVGRGREMQQLESLVKQLLAGKGWIVSIVGKAGLGKSRLMAEMKAQPMMDKVLLLEGRAVSTGQNLSFHPVTNLIKLWAGITEEDLPSVSSEKLYQGIKRNSAEQADEIYAFMATMMGLPLTGKHKERVKGIEGEALEKLILKNLRDLIIAATNDKPRIYMIEDMHWADSSSITLIESLYKLSQHYPVMFINVMRPGYKETGEYILKYLEDKFPGGHTTINIDPLEEKESENLIKNLLRNTYLPAEIQSMIIRKTEGNPFFIEEIIRSFIDEGIIEVSEGRFIVTGKINDADIPETINDAILSRVDKLDEKTRELLNTASVMGRNFYYKILEETTDTIEELDERLAYLTEVQLITESKKKEDIEYLFKHALAQQLTYDAMLKQSRKEIHLKIARSIEKVFKANINEFYGTLVYHYELAEEKGKTIYFMLLAGEEAMRSGASSEALQFYVKAHEMILADESQNLSKEQMLDLEMRIADLYRACGNNQEATERFRKLIETYTNHRFTRKKKRTLIRSAYSLLLIYIIVHNKKFFFKKKLSKEVEILMKLTYGFGTALVTMNPRQFAFDTLPIVKKICSYNINNNATAQRVFSVGSVNFGMTGISQNTSQKMIEISEEAGIRKDVYGETSFRMLIHMQNYYMGRWHSHEDEQLVIKQGLGFGSFWDTQTYIMYCGLIYIETGAYDKFLQMYELLLEQGENYNSSFGVSLGYRLAAIGFYKFRRLNEFILIAEDGKNFIGATENSAISLVFHCMDLLVQIKLGNINEAEEVLKKAKELQKQVSNMPVYHTPYLLAKAHFDLEKLQKLRQSDSEYRSITKEINRNSRILIAKSKKVVANLPEAYLLRVKLSLLRKKYSSAFKNLQLAIAVCEKHKSRLELSRAYFETGKFLSDPNVRYKELNGQPAGYYLEKAKAMFEEMRLEWDLEEWRRFSL